MGPALGGALLATAGVAACCAVNAASYGVPLFVLLRHRPAVAAAIGCAALAPATWLAIAGLVATGCLSIWFIAAANTLVQLATEPGMRGRVMGLWTTALPGSQVVNGPLAGWVTQDVGPREGFALSGMALAAIAATGWRVLTASPAPAAE